MGNSEIEPFIAASIPVAFAALSLTVASILIDKKDFEYSPILYGISSSLFICTSYPLFSWALENREFRWGQRMMWFLKKEKKIDWSIKLYSFGLIAFFLGSISLVIELGLISLIIEGIKIVFIRIN